MKKTIESPKSFQFPFPVGRWKRTLFGASLRRDDDEGRYKTFIFSFSKETEDSKDTEAEAVVFFVVVVVFFARAWKSSSTMPCLSTQHRPQAHNTRIAVHARCRMQGAGHPFPEPISPMHINPHHLRHAPRSRHAERNLGNVSQVLFLKAARERTGAWLLGRLAGMA